MPMTPSITQGELLQVDLRREQLLVEGLQPLAHRVREARIHGRARADARRHAARHLVLRAQRLQRFDIHDDLPISSVFSASARAVLIAATLAS